MLFLVLNKLILLPVKFNVATAAILSFIKKHISG